MEPFSCELDPDTQTTLKMYLFKKVQNIETIRSNIIKGNWECAVIKPCLILDPFQVAAAANRAVMAQRQGAMVTRTVFAEILFNLSLSKNISQSLTKFGIEKDREILVCFLISSEKDNSEEILSQIEGERCSMSELCNLTDLKEVKKVYKLNNMKCNDDVLDVVVSKMVTKSFVAH